MAMVATGPMPGSTPMSVPRRQPTKQKKRFCRVAAAVKPTARLPRMSMSAASEHRDRLAQTIDEDQNAKDRETDAERDGFFPLHLRRREGGKIVTTNPAVSISNANTSTAARIKTLGYHRPRSIGGPFTVTARRAITPPKMTRPMLSRSGM